METARTQAILLLTAHFSKGADSSLKPLTNKEWGAFALWLREQQLDPEKLLTGDLSKTLADWSDQKITIPRLEQLLKRGAALALAMEKWERSGLWVITRSDADYPRRLKDRLGHAAPPVLFGCGNRSLLNRGGIAIVGSRNTSNEDFKYSEQLGEIAATAGVSVISGGARGVDEASMLGTLQAEGMAIGVLANDLLGAATSSKYRRHIMQNNLLLVSPFYPEAGFNAGNAMQRNKYIYCLADAAIAVHSGTKGGTWEGALEDLRNEWVPLWIKPTDDADAGNRLLVNKGAQWLPENISEIQIDTLLSIQKGQEAKSIVDIFANSVREPAAATGNEDYSSTAPTKECGAVELSEYTPEPATKSDASEQTMDAIRSMTLYEHFLVLMETLGERGPLNMDELLAKTGLQKAQLSAWLKDAETEGKISKQSRPVRYQWNKQKDLLKD